MIKLSHLTKKFENKVAVDDLSFEVKEGEVFGLLGENGAGKTTTLRMMATMLKPTSGTVSIAGYDTIKEDSKVRENIGILFGGETGLYDRLTAKENIEYFGQLYDMDKTQLENQIKKMSEILDMKDYLDKPTSQLSKGMKQKVAFARATIHNPKVLLLDEPTSGLDVTAAIQVHEFIESIRKEGKTVIFSSHTMEEVEKLCDRVAIIHKGKLVAVDTLENLRKTYQEESLEKIFTMLIKKGEKE